MNWLLSLIFDTSSFAHGFLVYSLIISLGICLGRKKIFGLSLGATCVLFVGLIVGYAGVKVDPAMITFFRNFGLVLFVFFIGLQVGPSFFATFKSSGFELTGLMLLAVGLSLLITISLYFLFSNSISLPEILGIMFGAVTSTPGLGATQEALQSLGSKQDITVICLRLSVCDLSVIGVTLALKKLFGVNLAQEDKYWEDAQQVKNRAPIFYHVKTTNKALQGTH